MSTCTPVYGLEYAVGADRPCDINDTLCAFADSVESNLDRFDAIVDRTIDTTPMAQVRLTAPFSFDNTGGGGTTISIPFDTVDVDTDNMVDLASNPFGITMPAFGRYVVNFQLVAASFPVAITINASVGSLSNTNIGPYDNYLSDASVPVPMNGTYTVRYSTTSPSDTTTDDLLLYVTVPASVVTTINSARLTVYWLADLP